MFKGMDADVHVRSCTSKTWETSCPSVIIRLPAAAYEQITTPPTDSFFFTVTRVLLTNAASKLTIVSISFYVSRETRHCI